MRRVAVLAVVAGRRGDCGRAARPWPGRRGLDRRNRRTSSVSRPTDGRRVRRGGTSGGIVEPARRAAIRAVAMTGEVVRAGFISRRELIESFTTPGFGPTLAASTSEAVTAMLLELGERDADVVRRWP